MSRTPEVIIVGWRKALHDFLAMVAVIAGLVALVSFLVGGHWFLALVVFILSAYTSSNIKFKLVKKIEVGGFELQ